MSETPHTNTVCALHQFASTRDRLKAMTEFAKCLERELAKAMAQTESALALADKREQERDEARINHRNLLEDYADIANTLSKLSITTPKAP